MGPRALQERPIPGNREKRYLPEMLDTTTHPYYKPLSPVDSSIVRETPKMAESPERARARGRAKGCLVVVYYPNGAKLGTKIQSH